LSEQLRLFVSIEPPAQLKDALSQVQAELRQAVPNAAIRWTPSTQLHLTLRFLGKVESTEVDALVGSVLQHCTGIPPIALHAEGIGFFPGQRRPRVVWIGVRDSAGLLKKLHQAVQAATQRFSPEPPEDDFVGHITIGRIKRLDRQETRVLVEAAAKTGARPLADWTATSIELMKSKLSSGGATHIPVQRIPLS